VKIISGIPLRDEIEGIRHNHPCFLTVVNEKEHGGFWDDLYWQ